MEKQPSPPRSIQYWTENGTIQVGAERVEADKNDSGDARRERLKKAARVAESLRTVSVLIPVANLEQCDDLVGIAQHLINQGNNGRILLARIRTGSGTELAEEEATAQMEALAITMNSKVGDQIKVDWLVRPAHTRARGILDAASDENCSMILMHAVTPDEQHDDNQLRIGAVAKQVISGAEIPVLVFRESLRATSGQFNPRRVVVATDLGPGSARCVDFGSRIAGGVGIPMVLRNVIRPGGTTSQFSAQQDLKALIGEESEARGVRTVTSVVKAPSAEEGIRHEATRNDLTILGIRPDSAKSTSGHQTTASLFTNLLGPVLVVSVPNRNVRNRRFFTYQPRSLRPKLTNSEAAEMRWQIRLDATSGVDFIWMSVLSAAVAVFGLLTDSVPVLIGAMLVAPLMGPMIATGASLVTGDLNTLRRATLTTLQGIALVMATTYLLQMLIGPTAPTAEMIKRGSPTLLDCGIGVIGGIVGAYALARPGVAAASAGVAIAAALVPPLCVATMTLGHFPQLSLGAFILFIANVLAIIAAAGITLLFLGMEPEREALPKWLRRSDKTANAWLMVPVLGLAVISVITFSIATRATSTSQMSNEVDALLPEHSVFIEPSRSTAIPQLIVRVIGEHEPTQEELDAATAAIRARTSIGVRFIYEPVVRTVPSTTES